MAVNNMLEVVPAGMHKWVGMASLLDAMQLDASQVSAPAPPNPLLPHHTLTPLGHMRA